MTFDLDPAEDVKWKSVVECAFLIKEFLAFLHLKSFVKTTGGKGLHIVVPLRATISWDQLRDISNIIADLIVDSNPDKYIATMSKLKRQGKIFIDYLRNARGATAIGTYSTRANAACTISTPLHWDELSEYRSDSFTINNINDRLNSLKSDPWADFLKTNQSITNKIKKTLNYK